MLVLDEAMLDQWRTLNATEAATSTLLEAWLRRGRSEMLGAMWTSWMSTMLRATSKKSGCGVAITYHEARKKPFSSDALYGRISLLLSRPNRVVRAVGYPARRGTAGEGNWPILDARPTEFGQAVVETIFDEPLDVLISALRSSQEDEPDFGGLASVVPGVLPRVALARISLFPEPEQRAGVFVFKAKLGSVWRRIAVPAECELDALAWAIIGAFKFDGDHLYDFRFSGRDGSQVRVVCPRIEDAEAWTDEYSIGRSSGWPRASPWSSSTTTGPVGDST